MDMFDDDDALATLEDADLALLVGDDPVRQRSESDLSLASTFSASPSPHTHNLVVEAFCTFNAAIVHIDYPVAENGWSYRPDLGGHSLYRWDLGSDVCLVARHSTCSKAMRPRDKPCRNCEMKKTWRRECKEACNTFFLFALDNVQRSLLLLTPLIVRRVAETPELVRLYTNFVPKLSAQKKRGRDDNSKIARMIQLERNLRFSILNGAIGRVPPPMFEDAGEQLLGLLMDDSSDLVPVVPTDLTSPPFIVSTQADTAEEETTALSVDAPSIDGEAVINQEQRLESYVKGPLLSTPVARRPQPIVATVVSSPARKRAIASQAYEVIVDRLIDFDDKGVVVVLPSSIVPLLSRFPLAFHGLAELERNSLLSHLYNILGIDHEPLMLLKTSVLHLWLQPFATRSISVGFGFVSMPSLQIYQDLRTLPLLPCFFTESEVYIHDTFAVAFSACVPGTLPVMCAYYDSHGPHKVYGSRLLPIGV